MVFASPKISTTLGALVVLIGFGCAKTNTSSGPDNTKAKTSTISSSNGSVTSNPPGPEITNKKRLVGANVPDFPSGEPNVISVVAQATQLDSTGSLPIVVRNNTGGPVNRIKVAASARDDKGELVASGSDQQFLPNVVPAGEIAIGYIYFGFDTRLPKGAKIQFQSSATPLESVRFENIRDLDIAEFKQVGKKVVGALRNNSSETISGPVGVRMTCFDSTGIPFATHSDFAEPDTLPVSGQSSFQIEMFSKPCQSFLLGASGFAQ